MSAFSVIHTAASVLVLSDGAMVDETTGVLIGTAGKVFPLPKQNAVMVQRGSGLASFLYNKVSMMGNTFDELEMRIGDGLYGFLGDAIAKDKAVGAAWTEFDILIAGISEKSRGPRSFIVMSFDHPLHDQIKAWQPFDTGPTPWLTPGTDEMLAMIDPTIFDPERDGIRIMEAQRQILQPQGPKGGLRYITGGFAQLTTVTKEQITTKIIHRWPDKIGEKITPADTPLLAAK
jgi:hypothetical protein